MATEHNGGNGMSLTTDCHDAKSGDEKGLDQTRVDEGEENSTLKVESFLSESLKSSELTEDAALWFREALNDDEREIVEQGASSMIRRGCVMSARRSFETLLSQLKATKESNKKRRKEKKESNRPQKQDQRRGGIDGYFYEPASEYYRGSGYNDYPINYYDDRYHRKRFEEYHHRRGSHDREEYYDRGRRRSRSYDRYSYDHPDNDRAGFDRDGFPRGDSRSRSRRWDDWRDRSRSRSYDDSRRSSWKNHDGRRDTNQSHSSSPDGGRSESVHSQKGGRRDDGDLKDAKGGDPDAVNSAVCSGIAANERRSRRRSVRDRLDRNSRDCRHHRSQSLEGRHERSRSQERRSRKDRDRSYDRHERDRRKKHDERKRRDVDGHDRKRSRDDHRTWSPSNSPDQRRNGKDDENSSSHRKRGRSRRKSDKRRRDGNDHSEGGGGDGSQEKKSRSRRRRRSKDDSGKEKGQSSGGSPLNDSHDKHEVKYDMKERTLTKGDQARKMVEENVH